MTSPSRPGPRHAGLRNAAPAGATILLVGVFYWFLLGTRVGPLQGFWSIDQGVRIVQIQSLLATRFRSLASVYPGDAIDPKHQFTPLLGQYLYRDGRSYSMFSAVWAIFNSLPYRVFSSPGLYVVPIAATLGLLGVAALLTRGFVGRGWQAVLILALALTTPLFFYSLVFWDHTLVAMIALLALFAVTRSSAGRPATRVVAAGALLGFATWFRPEMVIAIPALAGAVLLADRPRPARVAFLLWLAAGAAATLLPFFVFNQLAYGSVLGPHVLVAARVTYRGQSLAAMLQRRADWAAFLIAPPRRLVLLGLGALLLLRFLYPRIAGARDRRRLLTLCAAGLAVVGVALPLRVAAILETSLLMTAPLVLLWLLPRPGPPPAEVPRRHVSARTVHEEAVRRASSETVARCLGLFAVLYVLLALLAGLPDGGNQWGPRMLLPAIAPLVIAGFLRLAEWTRQPVPAGAGVALVAAFLTLSGAGLLSEQRALGAIRTANEDSYRFSEAVSESGARVVVCSDTNVPKLLAPIFYDGYLVFRAESAARLQGLLPLLRGHGVRRFAFIDPAGQPLPSSAAELGVSREGEAAPLPKGYQMTILRIP